MKWARNAAGGASTLAELFGFLWRQRLWWLFPAVMLVLLIGALVVAAETTGVAPFIYTLF
jgi:hypothetical protein